MRSTALLDAQSELVRRVLRFEHPAERVVADFAREHPALGARDRRVLADGVFALVRKLALWRHLAASGAGAPERRLAILAWRGDEPVLQSALGEGERAWLERCRATDVRRLPEPLRHNLPEWLAEPLRRRLGAEFWAWVEATDAPAPLDLRVNALKTDRAEALARLAAEGVEAVPTPHSPLGLRVVGKPALEKGGAFAGGLVEVQDEGSQLLALVVGARRGETVVDFCAGAGGKTLAIGAFAGGIVEVQDEGSQLLALVVGARRGETVVDFCAGAGGKTLAIGAQMRGTGRLYAFDVSGHRLAALQPRLARSGLGNVHPMQIAHERDERVERLAGKVDRVLVDAPCTGSGTLRRHPDLKWRQNDASLAALATSQPAILAAAARLVKPGGRLVYATCSVLAREGEDVADEFERTGVGFFRIPAEEALRHAQVAGAAALVEGDRLRLWTHRHATDGFFAAVWQRASGRPLAREIGAGRDIRRFRGISP